MEKYIIHEFERQRGKFTLTSWRFTPEERGNFEQALVNFPKANVDLFINGLEVVCVHARSYFADRRDITLQRKERERILRRIEKTIEDLDALLDGSTSLQERKGIFDGKAISDETVFEKESLRWMMISASMQLKEISERIQIDRNAPGRPRASSATGDLVRFIAHGFKDHFGQPTGYRPSRAPGSGPFFAVVQIALSACDLSSEDPSRLIQDALKTL